MKEKKRLFYLRTLMVTLVLTCTLFVVGTSAASAQEKQNIAQALNSIGLFRGYDETGSNFGLYDVPTREQALIFQIRAMGEDQAALAWKGSSPYKDVPNTHWALPYIGYGTEKGYTNGMAPGIFGVGQPADARMMTTFVLRGMGYSDGNGDFTYENSVAYGYQHGLNESATLPTSFNRGDAAVILYNALSSTQKNGIPLSESLIKKGMFTADELLVARAIAKGESVSNIVKADFDFVNLTGKQINKLYMNTSNTEDWGENILGTSVLKSNDALSLDITFAKTTQYDILAVYSDGSKGEFRNLSFANANRDGGTIVLKSGTVSLYPQINLPVTFVNNTGVSITSLRASSSLIDEWSSNLVGTTFSNNSSRLVKFPMTAYDTKWDIQVVAGGKTYEFRNLDLSNADTRGIQLYLTMSGSSLVISENSGTQPTKVALRWRQVRVVMGKSFNMPAILTPTTSKTSVTYTSSNTAVARVDSKGKVTAVKTGTAVITAKTANGLTASCSVGVTSDPTPTHVELDVHSMNMKVGAIYDLNGLVHPLGGTINQAWSSSNSSVVKVNGNGVITALKQGVATITVKTYNGKMDTCKVTVAGGTVSSTSITLDKTNISVAPGKTYQLKGTIYPANTTDTVTWKSSNTAIATVNSSGLVKGIKTGTATITVTTTSGKTATCKVTVAGGTVSSTSITLDKTSISVAPGKTYQLDGTIYPANTTDTVTWKSSNTAIATVNSSGLVKGIKAGTATITVTTTSGKTATCRVTVTSDYVDKTVTLYNWTDKVVTDIRSSSSQNEDWGENLTVGTVQPNASVKIIIPVSATDYTYDFKITYSDGSDATFAGANFKNFTSGGTLYAYFEGNTPILSATKPAKEEVRNITVTFHNKTGQSITDFRASSAQLADWGSNLTSGTVADQGNFQVIFPVSKSDAVFDFKVTVDGKQYEITGIDFSAVTDNITCSFAFDNGSLGLYQN